MSPPRAEHVVIGEVVLRAGPAGIETAEAVGIAGDRVVSAGSRREVMEGATSGARVTDASGAAVVPGLHDFHLHLVAMARARRAVRLDDVSDPADLVARVEQAARDLPHDAWLTGRGWHEEALAAVALDTLEAAVGRRPAALASHDGHSLWASAAAREAAGIRADTPDPSGGRIERDAGGAPNGILREAALLPVDAVKGRLRGVALASALDETLDELAALGITGATDAGDPDARAGTGAHAALGDSFSTLADLAPRIDGRLRLTLDMPAAALGTACAGGLRSGTVLGGAATQRIGWAKLYADGALGSRTAALFAPHTCGEAADAGILRYEPDELKEILALAREAEVAMAIHAIGDRAVAVVLDGLAAVRPRGALPDRIEHAQLVRPVDIDRFAALDVTASLQPIHAAADRDAVEACWDGRQEHAYPWRSLAAAGVRLAFGSDAPIESVNPWHGMFAAVRRHAPNDGRHPWRASQAISASEALAGYTLGPALASGRADTGHLRPGAMADLAVLDLDLAALMAADERTAAARSQLTLVGGREVRRA